LALVLLASLNAKAQIIKNGSFQTGDFTDWTETLAASGSGLTILDNVPTNTVPNPGYAAGFGATGPGLDFIEQTFTSVPGTTYQLTFTLLTYDTPNDFQADIGGALVSGAISGGQLLDISDSSNDEFDPHTLSFTASSSSTNVIFGGYNESAYDVLDDVSVAIVPEPSSWMLLVGGLGALLFFRRFGLSRV
jgi:hypothetical protein